MGWRGAQIEGCLKVGGTARRAACAERQAAPLHACSPLGGTKAYLARPEVLRMEILSFVAQAAATLPCCQACAYAVPPVCEARVNGLQRPQPVDLNAQAGPVIGSIWTRLVHL